MDNANESGLEQALAGTEADVEAALKAAASAVGNLKKLRGFVHTGSLREIGKAMESAGQAIVALKQQYESVRENWKFDYEEYIADMAFIREVLEMSESMGIKIYEQDERLYCYPFLIRVLPDELSVMIDKTKEKKVRPSALVSHLKSLQNKPVKFKPEAFLESLYATYDYLTKANKANRAPKANQAGRGTVITLSDIYKVLTLLPGLTKEYSYQEFARDIYLLDSSGIAKTKKGYTFRLPASTGTKAARNTIRVITREGLEKVYYGISFHEA